MRANRPADPSRTTLLVAGTSQLASHNNLAKRRHDMKRSIGVIAGLMLAVSMCGTAFAGHGNAPANSRAGGVAEHDSWVVVKPNGMIATDTSGAELENGQLTPVTVHHPSTGFYEVFFNSEDVSDCAFNATIEDTWDTGIPAGHISVKLDLEELNDVEVQTFGPNAQPADNGFDLYLSCK